MDETASRRQFVSRTLAAGAGAAFVARTGTAVGGSENDGEQVRAVSSSAPDAASPDPGTQLRLRPRYHRWHVDPGVEWTELNTQYASLDWSIPLHRAALVLVDVWDHHYLLDTEARTEQVIDTSLLPLLQHCRRAGLTVIHAPSVAQAVQHPNYQRPQAPRSAQPRPDWPPREFISKQGEWKAYARPQEAREPELVRLRAERKLHPKIQPLNDEPVVGTGDELHARCRERGILFLLYAGFNTNACVLVNDYGTLAMSQRGYEVILVRDCTTGMENRETQAALSQTHGAVLFLEMFGRYSTTAQEIIDGLISPPPVE